jgi:hypothetical protein
MGTSASRSRSSPKARLSRQKKMKLKLKMMMLHPVRPSSGTLQQGLREQTALRKTAPPPPPPLPPKQPYVSLVIWQAVIGHRPGDTRGKGARGLSAFSNLLQLRVVAPEGLRIFFYFSLFNEK